MLIIVVTVMSSCNVNIKNIISDTETEIAENTNDLEMGTPEVGYDLLCYSISPDSETYNYGDVINIRLSAKLYANSVFYGVRSGVTFTIGESDYYEIIGESSIRFETYLEDYICGKEDSKNLVADFKIKINEPTYTVREIKFSVHREDYTFEHDYPDHEYKVDLEEIFFISDSQGAIISSLPYSRNHRDDPGFTPDDIIDTEELLVMSYDREYLNGIEVDELIRRYNKAVLGNRVYYSIVSCKDIEPTSPYTAKKKSYYNIVYISESVRLKIQLSLDHEYVALLNSMENIYTKEGKITYLKELLAFALENGAITKEDYETEINRLDYEATFINKANFKHGRTLNTTAFEYPDDNGYYTVLDFSGEGKTSLYIENINTFYITAALMVALVAIVILIKKRR